MKNELKHEGGASRRDAATPADREGLETCVSAKRTGLENVEFAADVARRQRVAIIGPIFSIRFVWNGMGYFPSSCVVDISSCGQLRRAYAETP